MKACISPQQLNGSVQDTTAHVVMDLVPYQLCRLLSHQQQTAQARNHILSLPSGLPGCLAQHVQSPAFLNLKHDALAWQFSKWGP